ncbi:hypothetical protein HDU93_001793 [Gonapodya sp. JEL0774]|nr:hypothetical protein HDU93_001793 [Gonapodya sp. JEL0774]
MGRQEGTEETVLWKSTCEKLLTFDEARRASEIALSRVNRALAKVVARANEAPVGTKAAEKLLTYYREGLQKADEELKLAQDASEAVNVLIALRDATEKGVERNRKKRKLDKGIVSSVSGPVSKKLQCVPTVVRVAVKPPDKDWLLATVIAYHEHKDKYEVEDVEEDEDHPGTKK